MKPVVIEKWSQTKGNAKVEAFLSRPAFAPEAEAAAAEVLADIRRRGNAAVLAAETPAALWKVIVKATRRTVK